MCMTGKNQKKNGAENCKKNVWMVYLLLRNMLDFLVGTEILSQLFAPPVHLYYNSST
jgi:hypothetical protein